MTKKILLVFLVLFTTAVSAVANDLTLKTVPAHLYFSPNGGATQAVVKEINNAKSEILVAAYSFTSAHSIFHNKVLTIDNETVVCGSMNFTKAGELAALYKENWIEHRNHHNNIK